MILPEIYENIFQKNLQALRQTHPDLAESFAQRTPSPSYRWLITESAEPTLEIQRGSRKVVLHSRHDPHLEAEREIQSLTVDSPAVLVCMGLGLGYSLEALLESSPASLSALMVVERDPDIFFFFLHRRDWSGLLCNPRLRIVISEKPDDILPAAQSLLPHIMGSGIRFLDHWPSSQLYPAFYTEVVKRLRLFLQQATAESEFLVHHGKLIQKNAILNIPCMCTSHGLGPLRDFYRDQPAVLISAGPSLRKNLHELIPFRSQVLVFCVDTAYRVALEMGIIPDFVAAADPTELNWLHFEGIEPNERVVLLFESDVYPLIPRRWKGPMIFINSEKAAINRWIEEIAGPFGSFQQGLSVAHSLYTAADWMGCDPLLLIGHDFAYSPEGGTTHAEGTVLNRKLNKIKNNDTHLYIHPNAYHPSDTQEEIVWVLGVRGKPVPTSKTLAVFLNKLSDAVRQSDRKVFDCSEGGALIEGTIPSRLRDILSSLNPHPPASDILTFLEEIRDPQELDRLAAFDELAKEIQAVVTESSQGLSQIERLFKQQENLKISDLKETKEWKSVEDCFWNVYHNRAVQILLGQALFPSLYGLIRQEKDESHEDRLNKYAQVLNSIIQLTAEFQQYLSDSRNLLASGCQGKTESGEP